MRGFSFIGGGVVSTLLRKSVLQQNDQRPKLKDKPAFQKETPKLLGLRELWLIHYFSIEKITLNPLKEILMYNTRVFIMFSFHDKPF